MGQCACSTACIFSVRCELQGYRPRTKARSGELGTVRKLRWHQQIRFCNSKRMVAPEVTRLCIAFYLQAYLLNAIHAAKELLQWFWKVVLSNLVLS